MRAAQPACPSVSAEIYTLLTLSYNALHAGIQLTRHTQFFIRYIHLFFPTKKNTIMKEFIFSKSSSKFFSQRRFNSVLAGDYQLRTTNTLRKPHFDLNYYANRYDLFKDICQQREVPFALSSDYHESLKILEELKQKILFSKQELNKMKKDMKQLIIEQKKSDSNHLSKIHALKDLIKNSKEPTLRLQELATNLEDKLTTQVARLPNLIHSSVKSKQKLVKYLNPTKEIIDSGLEDFPLKSNGHLDHKNIMEKLGLVDFKEATRVSGRGWYYLKGDAALLEQALVQYALKCARNFGFRMIIPPSIVKTEITNACGFRPRDQNNEKQVYELQADVASDSGLCLTGTAEIPLAGLMSNHTFNDTELPTKYVGISRSYREEAGAAGRDTRGLYRVHEFTKVELFAWTKNEEPISMKMFDELTNFQMHFIESLGLTARVLIMPYNDLGAPAYKKIDIEALMPGRGAWGELSSVSNCLDFQSRRLTTQWKNPTSHKLEYVHTLNATACAVPRVILAIVENFYDAKSRTIAIPKVLQPYMDDKTVIAKQ